MRSNRVTKLKIWVLQDKCFFSDFHEVPSWKCRHATESWESGHRQRCVILSYNNLGSPSWIWSIWCFSFLTYLELIVFVFLDVSIEVSKWTYCSSPLLASMKEKSKHVSTTIVLFNLIIYKKLRIHFLRTWHLHNIFEMYIA